MIGGNWTANAQSDGCQSFEILNAFRGTAADASGIGNRILVPMTSLRPGDTESVESVVANVVNSISNEAAPGSKLSFFDAYSRVLEAAFVKEAELSAARDRALAQIYSDIQSKAPTSEYRRYLDAKRILDDAERLYNQNPNTLNLTALGNARTHFEVFSDAPRFRSIESVISNIELELKIVDNAKLRLRVAQFESGNPVVTIWPSVRSLMRSIGWQKISVNAVPRQISCDNHISNIVLNAAVYARYPSTQGGERFLIYPNRLSRSSGIILEMESAAIAISRPWFDFELFNRANIGFRSPYDGAGSVSCGDATLDDQKSFCGDIPKYISGFVVARAIKISGLVNVKSLRSWIENQVEAGATVFFGPLVLAEPGQDGGEPIEYGLIGAGEIRFASPLVVTSLKEARVPRTPR